ncbi:MAG: chemotaxis protein CheA [Nitrospinota bacterium]|nr:chemotaxis protein CheA [Nitrospinota bacterium]
MSENDADIFKEYLAEVFESLDGLDEKFVQLEKNPGEVKIVDSIFRPVHSIKGSSAFFGLLHIQSFSHKLENLLDDIRKGKMEARPVVIDNLLKGTDYLKAMFDRVAEGDTHYELLPDEKEFIENLEARISVDSGKEKDNFKAVSDHLNEAFLVLDEIRSSSQVDAAILDRLSDSLRKAQNLVGGAAIAIESGKVIVDRREEPREEAAVVPEVGKLGEILIKMGKVDRTALGKALIGKKPDEKTGEYLIAKGVVKKEDIKEALKIQESEKEEEQKFKKNIASQKTMRISEEKVDEFMDHVGELIIISEVFNYLEKKLSTIEGGEHVSKEFKIANLNYSELTLRLQHGLSEVRKVAIKSIFQKIPRIIRDVATAIGKDVEVEMIGEEVMLDKSLVEKLESPIIHMVRNAVDHGVETPEKRKAAGKKERGKVVISAEIQGENLFIKLKDDGAGISRDKILEKAISKGLITQQAGSQLQDKEVYDFIFNPGFSTAEKVTDISGRGVGMDVVKGAIIDTKGKIEIESTFGKGSEFIISVPVSTTLITINGLVTSVGKSKFIFPVEDVRESIRPRKGEIFTLKEKSEMVNIRGEIYPLVRLHSLFNIPTKVSEPSDGVCLIIQKNGKSCCVLADAIVEQQNVVLKDLGKVFHHVKALMGGAILGDGSIGLVLSVGGLVGEQ